MNKTFVFLAAPVVIIAGAIVWIKVSAVPVPVATSVLGETSVSNQTHFDTLTVPSHTVSPTQSPIPITPTPVVQATEVVIIDGPGEVTEGNSAAFTWYVDGPPAMTHTTSIYYGTTSEPGVLLRQVTPDNTRYTHALQDFIKGTYVIPLRFIGNSTAGKPGTYFYRAYASVGDKHYWSTERSFVVKAQPKHEIKVLQYPNEVSVGGNAAFTWEVYGPASNTGFTAIVGGRQSKSGALEPSVDIPQTPYAVLSKDFTGGTYAVPLRFVGNAAFGEPGVYYFRALAFIGGKNIWSDEYSFTVK